MKDKIGGLKDGLIAELRATQECFERSSSCLTESDASFAPQPGMLTVLQQLAHVPQTIDWFIDGIQSPQGFDLDFEKHWQDLAKCKTVADARSWLGTAVARAIEVVGSMSEAELRSPLPEGPVMGGDPKLAVVGAIADHTAHHRGALTVYSRLLGKAPKMPYLAEA
ncbi:MAG: DinB family protein [Bdellovibrionales bacterium]|nr:DinB family protein [Bdellovibrionales bacterium]